MASFLGLMERSSDILADIFVKSEEAEQLRRDEYCHAVAIQAWYRGCRSRQYLKELHEKATEIQRIWRGYAARKKWRAMVAHEVEQLKSRFYNGMATLLQKTWRGYYSRKLIHDFYALKRYLRGIEAKNRDMRSLLADHKANDDRRRLEEEAHRAHRRLVSQAKSKHHLISTYAIPGVYNNPQRLYPEEMEFRLKAVTPLLASEKMREDNERQKGDKKRQGKELKLPPLPAKPQGPFKEPKAVYVQRHKPLSPSLRVECSYFSQCEAREAMAAEEWVNRVHDNRFNHVGTLHQPYEPLLHTSTPYRQQMAAVVRETTKDKWIASQDFKKLVPPIPVFDKFNKGYDDHCHNCC